MPKQFANSQDLVNVEEIRQNTIVLKNGGLRQILMIGGVNFALKSAEEQEALLAGYQNFLNSIDFPLQIIIHSRKINIQRYLDFLGGKINQEPSELLKTQIAEYREFVGGLIKDNAIMAKTLLLVVPFEPIALPQTGAIKKYIPFDLPFLKKKGSQEEEKESALEKENRLQHDLEQLRQRVTQVSEGIQAVGLEAKILNDEELIELLYNFYNPETVEKQETQAQTSAV